ncbi:MAG TPA: glycosyltransferase family A protein, partial [Vicinamibacterales bacterium]|nr:glycosyltransferase family A protein [Vicinamibacterales bacterium]
MFEILRDDDSRPVRLTAIVPATNRPATLQECLNAIAGADDPPEQTIVVDDPSLTHPAFARNAGARDAAGEVLVFVDADVTVHPDAFRRIRRAFTDDRTLDALFGSYDDAPAARGSVSFFRNLLHHHVHQGAPGPASTFWAGLGAVRRTAFEAAGGFSEHPIEDIELGMRMFESRKRIVLDPGIQGKHLKNWTLWTMLRTDLVVRGIPWVGLLLEHRGSASASTLNLGWRHRLSALASLLLLAGVGLWKPLIAGAAVAMLIALNLPFYALLRRKGGLLRATAGLFLHVLHHLVAVLAVPLGALNYVARPPR